MFLKRKAFPETPLLYIAPLLYCTSSGLTGLVVPIPTLPEESRTMRCFKLAPPLVQKVNSPFSLLFAGSLILERIIA